jgi:hypothetical protein
MFDNLWTSIEKLVTDFSLKKLLHLLIIVIVIALIVFTFDIFTNFFSLKKIENEVKILNQFSSIKNTVEYANTERILLAQLNKCISNQSDILQWIKTRIILPQWAVQGLSFMYPWLLIILYFSIGVFKKRDGALRIFGGSIVFTIFIGVIGCFIPVFLGETFRYLIFPVISFLFLVVALAKIGGMKKS